MRIYLAKNGLKYPTMGKVARFAKRAQIFVSFFSSFANFINWTKAPNMCLPATKSQSLRNSSLRRFVDRQIILSPFILCIVCWVLNCRLWKMSLVWADEKMSQFGLDTLWTPGGRGYHPFPLTPSSEIYRNIDSAAAADRPRDDVKLCHQKVQGVEKQKNQRNLQ